jgi:hypothetical protein
MLFQYKENDELVCSVKPKWEKKVAEQLKNKGSLAIALWLRRFAMGLIERKR